MDSRSLRKLSDLDLRSLHRQTQRDFVLRRVGDARERLSLIERELRARRLPCA